MKKFVVSTFVVVLVLCGVLYVSAWLSLRPGEDGPYKIGKCYSDSDLTYKVDGTLKHATYFKVLRIDGKNKDGLKEGDTKIWPFVNDDIVFREVLCP